MPVHLEIFARSRAKVVRGDVAPSTSHEKQQTNGAKGKEANPMMDTSKHGIYKGVKKEAAESLARLCDETTAPKTEKEVHAMLAHAFKFGDCSKAAAVTMQVMRWQWANLELHEHEEE